MKLFISFLCALSLTTICTANAITIETVQPIKRTIGDTIPLTESPDWNRLKSIHDTANGNIGISISMNAYSNGLLFLLQIKDPEQSNPYAERNLWRGDCIYLSIDGRGDTPDAIHQTRNFELDDACWVFGLGQDGPEGRVNRHGKKELEGTIANHLIDSIYREEDSGTTIYKIAIPWEEVSSAFGQSSQIGISLTIAHKNENKEDTRWGVMMKNKASARTLNYFTLPQIEKPFVTAAPKKYNLNTKVETAEIILAYNAPKGAKVTVALGQKLQKRKVKGRGKLSIKVPFSLINADRENLNITVVGKNLPPLDNTFQLVTPAAFMSHFRRRIKTLSDVSPNAIISFHLYSTLKVLENIYENLEQESEYDRGAIDYFMVNAGKILDLMPKEAYDWKSHIRKALPLVFSFVSERDRSLQFYSLQMPFNWDSTKTYPLTVFLHGAVQNINPITGLITSFDNTHQNTLFKTEDIDPDNIPPSHRGFVLAPWCRGNLMYKGIAQNDFWQAFNDVKKRFNIDEDRTYITGFSMGCHGAWAIASRTPDLWAGVNVASGFGDWSDTHKKYLAENAKELPLYAWIGELDNMLKAAEEFDSLVQLLQFPKHKFTIRWKTPHTYPYDSYQKCVGWLMQHSRTAIPDSFSFTADAPQYCGRNGVRIRVDYNIDSNKKPIFTCTIKEKTVTIKTKNTTGIVVDCTKNGLGLEGEVTIIWNGEEIYSGPTKKVSAGEAFVRTL